MNAESAEQHECGHNQEAATHADQAGDHTDDQAINCDLPRFTWFVWYIGELGGIV